MNPIVKAQLHEFSLRNALVDYAEATQFEIFAIDAVCNGALGEHLDALDGHLKGTEFGLDGIVILINGTLVTNSDEAQDVISSAQRIDVEFLFFQSKTSEKFDYGDIAKCVAATTAFLVERQNFGSAQVVELVSVLALIYDNAAKLKAPPVVRIYYCTTGGSIAEGSPIHDLRQKTIRALDQSALFSEVHLEFVGARSLQNMARIAGADISAEFTFARNVVLPTVDETSEAFTGYVPAEELLRLCTSTDADGGVQINKAVFYDNVRDYDDNSDINRSITESLRGGGGKYFVFRNNGVTLVARNLKRTGEKFIVSDFQIVNGCQTSHILFNSRAHTSDVLVPLRLIVSQNEDFISSVIIGTNNQNPVKSEQFWAFRPFLKGLEEFMRDLTPGRQLFLERRDNQYRGAKLERLRIISLQTLFKVMVATFIYEPVKAGRRLSVARQEYGDRLFHDDHDVHVYHAACFLECRLEALFRKGALDRALKIYRTYIETAVGMKCSGGRNIFNLGRKDQRSVSDEVVRFAESEDEFIPFVDGICKELEAIVVKHRGSVTRDGLRSDEVLAEFTSMMRSHLTPKT